MVVAGNLDLAIATHASDQKVQGGCAAAHAIPNVFALFPHMQVYFVERTNDEMCLGVFYYYPADQPSRYCGF